MGIENNALNPQALPIKNFARRPVMKIRVLKVTNDGGVLSCVDYCIVLTTSRELHGSRDRIVSVYTKGDQHVSRRIGHQHL